MTDRVDTYEGSREMDTVVAIRRNTRLLAVAQGFAQLSFPVLLVVGGVAAADLSGREGAAGLIWAVYFLAAAVGALRIGRWMDRVGRRPGLLLSYGLLAAAGVGCAIAIDAGSFWGLVVASIPFGVALGGANLARGAVADMHAPQARGRAVGWVLAAGTIGAIASPLLVAAIRSVVGADSTQAQLIPWTLVLLGAAGAGTLVLRVRPDPRDLAAQVPGAVEPGSPRGPRELLAVPSFRTAVVAAACGQLVMVGVMGVTPTTLDHLGHGGTSISIVISAHIAGMFAFAPLIGAALDRYGHRLGLIVGCCASVAGAIIAATEASAPVVGLGLFTIGIGWSATYLGATAVISDLTAAHERSGALGFTDLVVSLSSAAAGLLGAFVLEFAGYRLLGLILAAVVAVAAVIVARTPSGPPIATRPASGS